MKFSSLRMATDPTKIAAKDIMTKSVISVDSSATINEAAKMMEDAKVGAIVVMENNSPVGIVTDRDFAVSGCPCLFNCRACKKDHVFSANFYHSR